MLVLPCALACAVSLSAQSPDLDTVVGRLMAYTSRYGDELSSVLADERYEQRTEGPTRNATGAMANAVWDRRTIASDYALVRLPDGAWTGYRDAYAVNGVPLRDREDRLMRLLSSDAPGARDRAAAIVGESARHNLGTHRINRNINVPTLVVHLLTPRYRGRFSFRKEGEEAIGATQTWRIAFRERDRPTIVKRENRQDQPLRGTAWVDPMTGEVWRTHMTWEKGPGGHIEVAYGHVPGIAPLVPLTMSERYVDGNVEIRGEATYSDFRQFRTSSRILSR